MAKVLLCPGKYPGTIQQLKKAYERYFSSSKTELRIRSPCRSVEGKSLRERPHFESPSAEQDKSQEGRPGSAGIMQQTLLNPDQPFMWSHLQKQCLTEHPDLQTPLGIDSWELLEQPQTLE